MLVVKGSGVETLIPYIDKVIEAFDRDEENTHGRMGGEYQ